MSNTVNTKKRSILQDGSKPHKPGTKYTDAELERLADDLMNWIKEPENFWLKDFFITRQISGKAVQRFRERNESFDESYTIAQDIQESKLVKLGLEGKFNATLVIFSLKNVARWRDKPDSQADDDNDFYISFKGWESTNNNKEDGIA